ncbi:hypothetical protein, partial [Xylanibacter rarus]|uniref:hypothetical protein n=1 Tax=Xylanibacter rarus TaxID=1676614 RepID=UPI003FED8F7E
KRFYFSNPPFSHFLTNATKSQRLPQPLETQNKSSNLLFFAFLVILFHQKQVLYNSPYTRSQNMPELPAINTQSAYTIFSLHPQYYQHKTVIPKSLFCL